MSVIKNKTVAIVGGGPGGLTLARLLQLKGVEVKVFERDANKDARAKGATLDLHEESGLRALEEAGLTAAFRANYRPGADKVRVVDNNATIIFDEHAGVKEEGRPEIDRGPLQELLLNSLKPGTVIWDSQFVSLTPYGEQWVLGFKNGQSFTADVVIGADGANSKIRPYITSIKPFYSGYTAVEGAVYHPATETPEINDLLKGGKIFAMGNNQSLIVSSKGDGSLVFYTCHKTGEQWSRESEVDFYNKLSVLNWFKKEFATWDKAWWPLFEKASGSFVPRPLYCMPLNQTWQPQPNLTMLGDAAHLMPPYAGEGVNMAMLDALELSNTLTSNNYTDTLTAITHFEQQMRIRAAEAASESLESLEILHSPQAIPFMGQLAG